MYKNIIKYCILFNLILTFDLIFGKTINESQSKTSLDSDEKILVNNASNVGKIASPASAPKEGVQGKNKTLGVGVAGNLTPASSSNANETLPNTEDEANTYNMSGADWNLNNGALLRGFYVFIGLGALVVLYIVVKIIKLVCFFNANFANYKLLTLPIRQWFSTCQTQNRIINLLTRRFIILKQPFGHNK